jgi:hypothetical protein
MKRNRAPRFGGLLWSLFMATLVVPSVSRSSTAGELQKARDAGRIAFVLVTDPETGDAKETEDLIRGVMKQTGKATLIRMDRAAPENAPMVSRYRLSTAPIPLVLIYTSTGVIAGGAPAKGLTPERLLFMVPTPTEEAVISALQSGRPVLVLASRGGDAKALKACESASTQSKGKIAVIRVNTGSKTDRKFLDKLRIDPEATEPTIAAINAQGQLTGMFPATADAGILLTAANKTGGGCCPGGAKSAACAPGAKPTAACPTPPR